MPSRHLSNVLLSAVSVMILLYGVLVLNWSISGVIALFWLEMMLIAGFALLKILLALNTGSILNDLFLRFFLVFMGALGMGLIMFFIIMLSAKAMVAGSDLFSISDPSFKFQRTLLFIAYCGAFLGGYLFNGYFKKAEPVEEFLKGMVRIGVVMFAILLSGGLGGKYFANSNPMGVVVAIILAKAYGEHAAANIKVLSRVSD